MTSLITEIRRRAHKRAEWNRTRAELSRLPVDTALDLDIHKGDIDRIATRAVYGN